MPGVPQLQTPELSHAVMHRIAAQSLASGGQIEHASPQAFAAHGS